MLFIIGLPIEVELGAQDNSIEKKKSLIKSK